MTAGCASWQAYGKMVIYSCTTMLAFCIVGIFAFYFVAVQRTLSPRLRTASKARARDASGSKSALDKFGHAPSAARVAPSR